MKNMKKILVLLVILALMVTSIATVAIAGSDSYVGTVDAARTLIDAVDKATGSDDAALLKAKLDALVKVAESLQSAPIDPTSEGYDELIADYNFWIAKTFIASYITYDKVKEDSTKTVFAEADELFKIFASFSNLVPIGDDFVIGGEYECADCHREYPLDNFKYVLAAKYNCAACEGGGHVVPVEGTELSYEEAVEMIYVETLDLAAVIVDSFYNKFITFEGSVTYEEILNAKNALEEIRKKVETLDYEQPESQIYTGTLASAEALLNMIDENSSYEDLKAGLARVYTYLVENPVNPTSDAYLDFINKYDTLVEALIVAFDKESDSVETFEAGVALLKDMHDYLDETPVSQLLVETYNTALKQFAELYEAVGESLKGAVECPDYISPVSDDVADPSKIISTIEMALANPSVAKIYLETTIFPYINSHSINPAAEKYGLMIEKYNELVAIVLEPYYEAIESAITYQERYAALVSLRAYLYKYVLSLDAIEFFNTERIALKEEVALFYTVICNEDAIPSYKEETVTSHIKEATLNTLLANINEKYESFAAAALKTDAAIEAKNQALLAQKNAEDAYKAAEDAFLSAGEEEKAAAEALLNSASEALEEAKAAAIDANSKLEAAIQAEKLQVEALKSEFAILVSYVSGFAFDTSAAYYEDFKASYNSYREKVFAAIMRDVGFKTDADEKKLALKDVRAYLLETSCGIPAIEEYNRVVAELYADNEALIKAESLVDIYSTVIKENFEIVFGYSAKVQELASALESYKNTKAALENEIKSLAASEEALLLEMEALEAEIKALEEQIANETDEDAKALLEAELAALNGEKQSLKDEIANTGVDISEKKTELAICISNIEKTEAEIPASFNAYLEAYRRLAELNKPGKLDVTEACYEDLFKNRFERADEELAAFVYATLSKSFADDEMQVAVENAKVFAEFFKTANLKMSIEAYVKVVGETNSRLIAIFSAFENDIFEIAALKTNGESLKSYLDTYANLTELSDKVNTVAKIYELYVNSNKSFEKIFANNAELLLECEAVFDSFSNDFCEWLETGETLEEKYVLLVSASTMLNKVIVSQETVDAYNDLLAELKVVDFDKMSADLSAAAKAIEYAAPNGFSSDFSAVNTENLYEAYAVLMATKLDFANKNFAALIRDYANAKELKAKAYNDAFKACKDSDEKVKYLKAMCAELKANPTSYAFVELYDALSNEFFTTYSKAVNELMVTLDKNLQLANKLVSTAGFDETTFRDNKANADKLETLLEKIYFLEYESAFHQISKYNEAVGESAKDTQNSAFNQLSTNKVIYNFNEDFVTADIANALALETFRNYLDRFESENSFKTASKEEKDAAIKALKALLEEANSPAVITKEFNLRYPEFRMTPAKADNLAQGSVKDFIDAVTNYANATDFSDKEAAILSFIELLNTKTLDNKVLYTEVDEQYENMKEEINAETLKKKEELGLNAPVSDYSLPVIFDNNSESSKPFYTTFDGKSGVAESSFATEANGNKYLQIKSSGWSPFFFVDKLSTKDQSKGLVFEFDLMSTETLNFNVRVLYPDGDTKKWTSVLNVTNNELDFKFKTHMAAPNDVEPEYFDNYPEGSPKITWKPGEWRHVVIVFDVVNNEYEVCIDYQSLGRKPLFFFMDGLSAFDQIRLHPGSAHSTGSSTVICMDNVKLYSGSAYRNTSLFDGMTDADKFSYFVRILGDKTLPAANRINAYSEAVALVGAEGIDAGDLAIFNAFDFESVSAGCREETLLKLEGMAASIMDLNVDSNNVTNALASVNSIRKFIENNTMTLDQANSRFVAINAKLQEIEREADRVEKLKLFIEAIERFHRAPTLSSLKRHYATADEYYRALELDIAANMQKAARDPLSSAFISSVSKDEDVKSKLQGVSVTLQNYYDVYTVLRMADRLSYENSEKFINCVEAIELLITNKDELTKEEYEAAFAKAILDNSDYVSAYMVVLNRILISGEYDAEFEGFEEAKLVYDFANEVFYTALQNEYYAVIKQNLDRYASTNSYIEKAGICAYIENYIKDNNVDVTTETGASYVSILRMCQEELEIYMADYAAILNANTEKFIGLVNKMKAYSSYKDLKPLYDEAIQNYYYSMNVDSDEAKAALATFASYEEMIFDWELNGKLFVDNAKALSSARRTAQKYRALVNCAKYVDKIDAGVEGVADALKTYEKVLGDYNEQIGAVNGEIEQAVDAACAVRTNSVAAVVLAIIKSIFSK